MAIYIPRSLVGSDNDDTLTYGQSYIGDGNVDAYLYTSSIYGMGGNDVITVGSDESVRYIDGGSGNDVITNNNDLDGTVHGGEDNDTINYRNQYRTCDVFGDAGDDTISYDFSVDYNYKSRLNGGDGVDTLVLDGDFNGDWVSEFEILKVTGDLYVRGGQLSEFTEINVGSSSINFDKRADLSDVQFSAGKSTVSVNGSNSGDNFDLSDQSRSFSILGGGGNDTIIAGAGRLFVDAGAGIDFLQGSDANDILNPGYFSKYTAGLLETVLGKGGDDVVSFYGTRGVYDGGDGIDTFKTSTSHLDMTLSLGGSVATNFERLEIGEYDTLPVDLAFLQQFETIRGFDATLKFISAVKLDKMPEIIGSNFTLMGSVENDSIVLNSTKTLSASGDKGDDFLKATTRSAILDGGAGNDTLIGSSMADTITGGTGNDSLTGGEGNDSLDGGHGLDIIRGGNGNDTLHMTDLKTADHQTLYGDAGNDRFIYGDDEFSGTETPWALAKPASLVLIGGAGDDWLRISGNLRNVEATGIEHLDFYGDIWARPEFLNDFKEIKGTPSDISATDSVIHLTAPGTWTWKGSTLESWIEGTEGVDILDLSGSTASVDDIFLNGGNDVIRFGGKKTSFSSAFGDWGNDTAYSGKGTDEFSGYNGADRFIAGAGNDTFTGGDGHDVYVAAANTGVDTFADFEAKGSSSDVIDLSGVSAIKDFADLKAHHLKGSDGYFYVDLGAKGSLNFDYGFHVENLTEANFLF
jgi:Ca2+-binding RTX toxin-like protein